MKVLSVNLDEIICVPRRMASYGEYYVVQKIGAYLEC